MPACVLAVAACFVLHGVSKWCTCWTVGCLYAVQLLRGVVRTGTAVLCVVWSGLVQLCFVWCLSVCCSVITQCGQDWYSCTLCGDCLYAAQLSHSVVRPRTAVFCVVWSGPVWLYFVWCMYAVHLSHGVVRTGTAVLCVVYASVWVGH